MSNHEAFNYLEHVAGELRRMLELQKTLPPESGEYAQLMRNMEVLVDTVEMYASISDFFEMADTGITKIEIIPGGVPATEDAEDTIDEKEDKLLKMLDGVDKFVDAVMNPVADPPAQVSSEPEKTYEMSEVRAALVAARRRGVNVTEILKEYGVDNFGAFPAGKYGELMERLGET